MTPEEAQAVWDGAEIPTPDQGRLAFARFLMNGRPHELRVLGSSRVVAGVYATPEELASAAAEADGLANVYVTANPVSLEPVDAREVGTGGCAGDDDIARIRWFVIDLDCYDDPEQLPRLKDHLDDLGWPRPLVMASGGGYWLLYRYDAENTPEETRLRERALRTLKTTFSAVDTSVSNASRIIRFAYTRNLKQHRMSYLVTPHDVELEPLQRQLLEGVAGGVGPEPEPKDGVPAQIDVILEALAERGITVVKERQLERGLALQLSVCPFYPEKAHGTAAALYRWNDGNVSFRCLGDTCTSEDNRVLALEELLGIVRARATSKGSVALVRMTAIRPRRAETVWGTRINRNQLFAIVGAEKVGKGLLMARLIGEITTGRLTGKPETIAYASAEENIETRVFKTLAAVGADPDRVLLRPQGSIGLPDALEPLLAEMRDGEASWLFLDPINKHFSSGLDTSRGRDVAEVLGAIAVAAAEQQITIGGSLHTNRASSVDARSRWAHSQEFRRQVRSAVIIGRTVQDAKDERTIVHDFNNDAEESPALQARIRSLAVEIDGDMAKAVVLDLLGEVDVDADQLFLAEADHESRIRQARQTASKQAQCGEAIRERWNQLGRPREMESSAFETQLREFDERTIRRARSGLGIESERERTDGKLGGAIWSFPEEFD